LARCGRSPLADNPGKVEDLAVAFYRLNEDPNQSPNLQIEEGDDYSFLMDLLDDKRVLADPDLSLALLRVMKVLSRKLNNRNNLELEDIQTVAKYLRNTESSSVTVFRMCMREGDDSFCSTYVCKYIRVKMKDSYVHYHCSHGY